MSVPTSKADQERIAGVLVPVFAIRREYDLGIGDVTGLKEFVDWARDTGLGFVQVLPINEMGRDNSPYNAISSVALEPMLLDTSPGVLPDLSQDVYEEVTAKYDLAGLRTGSVDYEKVRALKSELLWKGFQSFRERHYSQGTEREKSFLTFCEEERSWLYGYCLYRLFLEMENGQEDWERWPEEYRTMEAAEEFVKQLLERAPEDTELQLEHFAYVQFLAWEQWTHVADYSREHGVKLMGDIPFGVSRCSADVYSNPAVFNLEWFGGAPPETNFKDDDFVVQWGQNWGIPLYRWDEMAKDDYGWWRRRVQKVSEVFDVFRIDHALGFYRIYSFPWRPDRNQEFVDLSHDEARERTGGHLPGFQPGPDDGDELKARNRSLGEQYLRAVKEAAGSTKIVAEDLGMVPDYVPESLLSMGMAGMKVPQWECDHEGEFRSTDSYPWLSLTTYATHDHEPMKTQWNRARRIVQENHPHEEVHEAMLFIHRLGRFSGVNMIDRDIPEFGDYERERLLSRLFASTSCYAAVMITDLLGLEDRFNVPGVLSESNWSRRLPMTVNELKQAGPWAPMSEGVKNLIKESGRLPVEA